MGTKERVGKSIAWVIRMGSSSAARTIMWLTLAVLVGVTVVSANVTGQGIGRQEMRADAERARVDALAALPDWVDRDAATAAETAGIPLAMTAPDGCHHFVRMPAGKIFWVETPTSFPAAKSWEVGARGWPTAGCDTEWPTHAASEPCDRDGPHPCGAGGSFGPGITDGAWMDPTDGGRISIPPQAPAGPGDGLRPGDPIPPGVTCTRGPNGVKECTLSPR